MPNRIVLLLLALSCALYAVPLPGKILWEDSLTTDALLQGAKPEGVPYRWEKRGGPGGKSGALVFEVRKPGDSCLLNIPLDPKRFHGNIAIEADVKGSGLKPFGAFRNGPCFSLIHRQGKRNWYPNLKSGFLNTYDWKRSCYFVSLGDDCTELTLRMGIYIGEGTLSFSNLRIRQLEEVDASQAPKPPVNDIALALPRGDNRGAKYRGVMSGNDLSPQAFDTLRDWGANLLRYQIKKGWSQRDLDISTPEKYLAWIDTEIKALDEVLRLAEKNHIKVIIDLHTGPGTTISNVASNILTENTNVATLRETWKRLSRHYWGNRNIYGYDLLNEPSLPAYGGRQAADWQTIVKACVKDIREIDQETPILVAWLSGVFVLPDAKNIIYTPHYYSPMEYSHMGVIYKDITTYEYPGWISGEYWDREMIRTYLKRYIDTIQEYPGTKVCVGEFGASVWCRKGRDKYIADCISIFEEYGWDWCFHAFREWGGWSAEHRLNAEGKIVNEPDEALIKVLTDAMHAPRKP